MTALIERSEETISVDDLGRSAKEIINNLASGEHDHFVIMKNNSPAAVLLTTRSYEALLDDLEDLRIEAVVRERSQTFDKTKAITHDEMIKK